MTRSTKPEEGTKVGQGGERTLAIIPDIIQRVTVDQAFKNTLMRFPPSNWKRIAVSTIRLLISIPSKLTIDFFFFFIIIITFNWLLYDAYFLLSSFVRTDLASSPASSNKSLPSLEQKENRIVVRMG